MRRNLVVAACTLALGLSLLGAGEVKAAPPVAGGSVGPGAAAFWEYENADGGLTSVSVFAGESRPLGGPAQLSSRFVAVSIWTFFPGNPADQSDDRVHFIEGEANVSEEEFTLSGRRLDSASLEVTIPAQDCMLTGDPPIFECADPTTITVDLTWAATGPVVRQHGSFHFQTPDCMANQHFSFRGRPAQVEGAVTSEGTDYTRGETAAFGDLIISSRYVFVGIGDCFGEVPAAGEA